MHHDRAAGRQTMLPLAAIVALGLVLRVAGAQGGLWLDEAWSAVLAHEAGTPAGVFLNINHDNNHHLNSLWLQAVGAGASPLLARALSIVTGTLAIVVAGLIAAPRGRLAILVTAWLFAVSPILVTMGSEARGYAPMTLALLAAVAIVDRQLRGSSFRPQVSLALCFFLGALAQLTMVFGVCAIIGWYASAMWRREGFGPAVPATVHLFAVPLGALVAALALVFVPAMLSPTGFQFGRYDPFDFIEYLHGIVGMIGYTMGLPIETGWLVAAALALVVLARPAGASKIAFHRLAIIAFPVTLALLRAGNVAYARYYLVAAMALLLAIGELVAIGWVAGGWRRWIAAAGLLAISAGATALDLDLIRNQRGDPGAAVRAMQSRAPAGAALILTEKNGYATIAQAATMARYTVTIQKTACPPQPFLLISRSRGEDFLAQVRQCGARYQLIEARRAHGLSGIDWTLYQRRP